MKKIAYFVFSFAVLLFAALPAQAAETVDINSATASKLATELVGVGPKRAAAIVAYRKANGPFETVDRLTDVPGIGEGLVEQNRKRMTVRLPDAMAAKRQREKRADAALPAP